MTIAEALQPGSYKGISFLMTSSSITGGRKDVKHSFPNSSKQIIEDMGPAPRVFNITMILGGGDDYFIRRDDLVAVLSDGEIGDLVLPMYGRIENIAARTYTLNENLNNLGNGRITAVFEISDASGLPVVTESTISVISNANDDVLEQWELDIVDNYEVTPSLANSFTDALDKANGMIDEFNEKTKFIQAAADEINLFNSKIAAFQANITSIVQSPQALADSVNGLFDSVNSLYPTAKGTLDVLAGFFGFGDSDIPRTLNTASRIERDRNDKLMNSAMQSAALSYSYLNAAKIEYVTVDEIEEAADGLEAQYQKVIAAEGMSNTTKDLITTMRKELQLLFDQQKLTARQLIDVETNLTSTRLLAYQYYGDSTEGSRIASINNVQDIAFVEGPIKVLTA